MKKIHLTLVLLVGLAAGLQAQETISAGQAPVLRNKLFFNLSDAARGYFTLGYERRLAGGKIGLLGSATIERQRTIYVLGWSDSPQYTLGGGLTGQVRYYPGQLKLVKGKIKIAPFLFAGANYHYSNFAVVRHDPILNENYSFRKGHSFLNLDAGAGIEVNLFRRFSLDLFTGPRFQPHNGWWNNSPARDYLNRNPILWQGGITLGFKF